MEQIIIQVEDKLKAKVLLELLNNINFINDVKTFNQPVDINKDIDFFSFAGIWADRNISLKSIRQKAWPRQTL